MSRDQESPIIDSSSLLWLNDQESVRRQMYREQGIDCAMIDDWSLSDFWAYEWVEG